MFMHGFIDGFGALDCFVPGVFQCDCQAFPCLANLFASNVGSCGH